MIKLITDNIVKIRRYFVNLHNTMLTIASIIKRVCFWSPFCSYYRSAPIGAGDANSVPGYFLQKIYFIFYKKILLFLQTIYYTFTRHLWQMETVKNHSLVWFFSQSDKTFFAYNLQRIFPFFTIKLGHFLINQYFCTKQAIKPKSKNLKTKKEVLQDRQQSGLDLK